MREAKQVPEVGVTRRTAFVPQLRGVDEQKRTIEFVASTEATDRYGDIIRVAGWKTEHYLRNPVFLWAHRSGDPPIGKTVKLSIETNPPALVQTVEFADAKTYPFADTVFQLYRNGFMKSVSVGFRPLEKPKFITSEETGAVTGYEFTSQELLELSAVPIPANPEAVARAVGDGIVLAADVEKLFAVGENDPKRELLDALGRLEDAVANLQRRTALEEALIRSFDRLSGILDREPYRSAIAEVLRAKRITGPATIDTAEKLAEALRGNRN